MLMSVLASAAAAAITLPSVSIEARPAAQIVTRQMVGDYSQHAIEMPKLVAAAGRSCGPGMPFGEYPQDPDAVGLKNVHWTLGYQTSVAACRSAMAAPYMASERAPEIDAVVETKLTETKVVGLSLSSWLAASGYVQSGSTRIEFFDPRSGPAQMVRIVVPVKRRTWATNGRPPD